MSLPALDAPVFLRSGKVRDIWALGDDRLVLVASDRISAFDVVLPTPIPDKGRVLTGLSRHWFAAIEAAGIIRCHLVDATVDALPATLPLPGGAPLERAGLRGRTMICRRADPLPVEVIVRGHLAGSGWKDYLRDGAISGVGLPPGLREGDLLPEPILTPSTKASAGHDETIDFDAVVDLVGGPVAERAREVALALYAFGASRTAAAGILLADTKFELGVLAPMPGEPDDPDSRAQRLILIDEALTPDSSRFWDAAAWDPGQAQASFDKQFVRDWLEAQAWDKRPPAPELPDDVVAGTRARYEEAFERITGGSFARYLSHDEVAP